MTRQALEFISYELDLSINRDEVRELLDQLNSENDFWIEIDGQEYRFIHADVIWETYKEAIEETTKDCYLGGNELPWWIEIDWEKTAENCLLDGYGHQFSSYDGYEIEYTFGEENYHIFRTN